MWRRTMGMILDPQVADSAILLALQGIHAAQEIKAQEISTGDMLSRHGTLMHAAAMAGRVAVGRQLLRYGAEPGALNYDSRTPLDLALEHGQAAMTQFLDPVSTEASTWLEPEYARHERDLVWAQRRRRQVTVRQVEAARLSLDERDGALLALDEQDREEWFHLEGTYLSKGLAMQTIEAMKARRSMYSTDLIHVSRPQSRQTRAKSNVASVTAAGRRPMRSAFSSTAATGASGGTAAMTRVGTASASGGSASSTTALQTRAFSATSIQQSPSRLDKTVRWPTTERAPKPAQLALGAF